MFQEILIDLYLILGVACSLVIATEVSFGKDWPRSKLIQAKALVSHLRGLTWKRLICVGEWLWGKANNHFTLVKIILTPISLGVGYWVYTSLPEFKFMPDMPEVTEMVYKPLGMVAQQEITWQDQMNWYIAWGEFVWGMVGIVVAGIGGWLLWVNIKLTKRMAEQLAEQQNEERKNKKNEDSLIANYKVLESLGVKYKKLGDIRFRVNLNKELSENDYPSLLNYICSINGYIEIIQYYNNENVQFERYNFEDIKNANITWEKTGQEEVDRALSEINNWTNKFFVSGVAFISVHSINLLFSKGSTAFSGAGEHYFGLRNDFGIGILLEPDNVKTLNKVIKFYELYLNACDNIIKINPLHAKLVGDYEPNTEIIELLSYLLVRREKVVCPEELQAIAEKLVNINKELYEPVNHSV